MVYKKPTELRSYHGVVFVNTLLSIDKGIDCVSGLFSVAFEKDSVTCNKNLGGMWDKMQPIG